MDIPAISKRQTALFGAFSIDLTSDDSVADAVSAIIYPLYSDTLKEHKPIKDLNINFNYPFARASLVKNDPFLTALGRPNRENVSTSRSSQASLLQALDDTHHRMHELVEALGDGRLQVPYHPGVNPPLWEIGHVGWFQERWCLRHGPGRELGASIQAAGKSHPASTAPMARSISATRSTLRVGSRQMLSLAMRRSFGAIPTVA